MAISFRANALGVKFFGEDWKERHVGAAFDCCAQRSVPIFLS